MSASCPKKSSLKRYFNDVLAVALICIEIREVNPTGSSISTHRAAVDSSLSSWWFYWVNRCPFADLFEIVFMITILVKSTFINRSWHILYVEMKYQKTKNKKELNTMWPWPLIEIKHDHQASNLTCWDPFKVYSY